MANTDRGTEAGARKHNHLPIFGRAASPAQQTPEPSLDQPPQPRHRPGSPRKLTWTPGQTRLPGDAEAATHVFTILPGPRTLGTPARRAPGGDGLPTVILLLPTPWHTRDQGPSSMHNAAFDILAAAGGPGRMGGAAQPSGPVALALPGLCLEAELLPASLQIASCLSGCGTFLAF